MDSPEPHDLDPQALTARLRTLHARHATERQPWRLQVADALHQRLHGQGSADPALQAALAARLQAWLVQLEAQAPTPARRADARPPGARRSLADAIALARPAADSAATAATELPGLARFRQTWARVSAHQRVQQGQLQGPANAGPLNPHKLALRTLALMDELSPDYLARMVQQLDTLLWLEQAPVSRPAQGRRPRPGNRGETPS